MTATPETPGTDPADLFAGLIARDATLPAEVPTNCPSCGSALVLSRIYTGREEYPIASLSIEDTFPGADPRGAYVSLGLDALTDEYVATIDEQVQCRYYGLTCDYRLHRDAIAQID